jgi:hypothetical protein
VSEWEPPEVVIQKPRPWRKVLAWIVALPVAAGLLWHFRDRLLATKVPPAVAVPEHVRSEVTAASDSLDVIVSWQFTGPGGPPDSVRVEVGLEGTDAAVHLHPGKWRADTLRLVGPPPGTTAMGHSCVSSVHGSRLTGETCTPWQFVRPSANETHKPHPERSEPPPPAKTGRVAGPVPEVLRIVVRPSGRQVDPDVGGKCAQWQRNNPDRSVWIEVNDRAVAECTGPNGKPTVAQFCAFAVLQNGERVKTENSTNNPYCERLYQDWVRERIS